MRAPSRDPSLAQQVRRRNATELAAAAGVFVGFGAYAVALDPWPLRLGAGLLMLGVASVATTLWRRGPLEPTPPEPSLAWQRRQLARQRDLLASVPR